MNSFEFGNLFDVLKDSINEDEIVDEDTDDEENIISKSELYCNKCLKESIKNIKGELICMSCSTCYGVSIDSGAEWRFYGSDDSKGADPNRCGMPTNSLLPEFSIGSIIPYRNNESFHMKKIRNYNTWIGSCYREKSLYNVFESISIRAKNYGIPNCIIEDAKYKYKIISEVKISRGENRIGIIASCLFIACYENKSRRSIKEIAEIFKIPPTSMTKGFKKFNEIMLSLKPEYKDKFNSCISESVDFINRFCSNLNLEKEIIDICRYVCNKIEQYDLVSENTPTSKTAGSIYLVVYLFDLDISKKDISNTCSTSDVTICKCFSKLIDYYVYLIPEDMLQYLALDYIHKFSNSLIKYFNSEIHNKFLQSCLILFKKCISDNLLKNTKHVTFLSAGVVYYMIKEFKFDNLSINNITTLYNIQENNVLNMYKLIKENEDKNN